MRMENEKQNKQQVLKLREHISSMEQKLELSSKVNPSKYISFQFLKNFSVSTCVSIGLSSVMAKSEQEKICLNI